MNIKKLNEKLSTILNEADEYTYAMAEAEGQIKIYSNGSIDCSNLGLTSLEGAPQTVEKHFNCQSNDLNSLKGAPKKVGGDFICEENGLTSLEGAPKEVGGNFNCSWNSLTSLEGAPEKVKGTFDCSENSVKFNEEDVIEGCEVKGRIKV